MQMLWARNFFIYLFFDCYRVKDDFQSVLRTLLSFYVFSFVSCKTTQNVNILQLLAWSKFKVSCQWHYGCEASFLLIRALDETTRSSETQWGYWKKNLTGLKYQVCGVQTNKINLHYIKHDFLFINIRVLRLCSIDCKSSLMYSTIGTFVPIVRLLANLWLLTYPYIKQNCL